MINLTPKPIKKIKVSNLINILLTIILIAILIFGYFYLNSKNVTAFNNFKPTLTPEPPKFLANIYSKEPMENPLAVAINKDDKLIVADSGNSRIQIFNRNGQFERQFGRLGSNPGEFNYPTSVAVNSEGLIYVGDFNNNRIQVFSEQGRLVNTLDQKDIGQIISPLAMVFDEDDNLYFTNKTGRVIGLNRNGEVILNFGEGGSKSGFFSYPNGITIGPNKNIYVSDSGNFRIQIFDSKGKLLDIIEQNKLNAAVPKGIAIDDKGFVYLVDNFQHKVNVYDENWNFVFSIGTRGLNEGQLNYPNGICIKDNKVYITDRENNRVAIFRY